MQQDRVYSISCRYCDTHISNHTRRGYLLHDRSILAFSTDEMSVSCTISSTYYLSRCGCDITDIICKLCGNVVGSCVVRACHDCLTGGNNGNHYIFYDTGVIHKFTGLRWNDRELFTVNTEPIR